MNVAIVTDSYTKINRNAVDYFNSDDSVNVDTWLKYDIVILLSPYTERALISWTGHPHLRCCSNSDEAEKEIVSLESNVETEKKYLIGYPDIDSLKIYSPYKSEIEQIYLLSDIGTRRIRKRSFGNKVVYYETVKVRMTNSSAHEYEHTITKEEYISFQGSADPLKRPIVKSRYCFVYKNQYFELDVYDFWNDRAVVEIELINETDEVFLPPEFNLIKDVSEDLNYKNSQLARIDYEDS